MASIKEVLTGKLEFTKINKDSILAAPISASDIDLSASDAELELRKQVDEEDKKPASQKVNTKK